MKKRNILVAAMTLTLAGATLLSGCGLNADATLVNINKGEDSISLGYGNFVARYTQSLYDATYLQYMGTDMWTKEDAAESVLQMNKLQAECMEVLNKKCALSEKTKLKVMEICKEVLPDENGDPRLCDDNEKLKELKKKLMAVRKIA